MENLENTVVVENEDTNPETEFTQTEEVNVETTSEVDENIEDTSAPADYIAKDDDDEEESTEDENDEEVDDDEDEKGAKKYEALETELNDLKASYSALQTQYQELVNFKNEIDNQKKDALIAEFYMLSDEDKADVIQNKNEYSLDDIKAKLSVICFDKKINFTLSEEDDSKDKDENIMIYNLNDNEDDSLPDWVKAVKEQEKLG